MRKLSVPWILLAVISAGCLSVDKEYPVKRFFVIEAGRGEHADPPMEAPVLRLRKMSTAPELDGKSLIYRTGDLSFETDFYNAFFISPGSMLGGEVRKWLEASGRFALVTDSAGGMETDYVLMSHLAALYGDHSEEDSSKAVMEIQFLLLEERDEEPAIVLQKNYREAIPLTDRDPATLARGFSDALRKILDALEQELAGKI